jgi:hypothetical protein
MTPIEALQKAIFRGGWPSVVSSRRHRRYDGVPGEIIAQMAPEVREALAELRSSDIEAKKLSRFVAWLGYEGFEQDHLESSFRRDREEFERKVLHLEEGPRTARRRLAVQVPWGTGWRPWADVT